MNRVLPFLAAIFLSRATTPLILSGFLLLYIGIAFFSPEPLSTLFRLTAHFPLSIFFAVVPLNCGARLIQELRKSSARRAFREGAIVKAEPAELYDEYCTLTGNGSLAQLQERLNSSGYRTRLTPQVLAAWSGVQLAPARILFHGALSLFFAGMLLSIMFRTTQRATVIEGEPFLQAAEGSSTVTGIALEEYHGLFLEKTLAIDLAEAGGSRRFGLYPPSLYGGRFVYPRYLGVAPLVRFIAPGLPAVSENYFLLSIYPPGREDSAAIPDSPYRIAFTMADPEPGNEPFRSGRFDLSFRIMQGDTPVAAGSLPLGGRWEGSGYRLDLPDFRRTVTVDLVRDYGLFSIWGAMLLCLLSFFYWLPVRFFSPCREMIFHADCGTISAFSRAEGAKRQHAGVFHEALDFLAATPGPVRQIDPPLQTEGG